MIFCITKSHKTLPKLSNLSQKSYKSNGKFTWKLLLVYVRISTVTDYTHIRVNVYFWNFVKKGDAYFTFVFNSVSFTIVEIITENHANTPEFLRHSWGLHFRLRNYLAGPWKLSGLLVSSSAFRYSWSTILNCTQRLPVPGIVENTHIIILFAQRGWGQCVCERELHFRLERNYRCTIFVVRILLCFTNICSIVYPRFYLVI
jgi:hypothetical protein